MKMKTFLLRNLKKALRNVPNDSQQTLSFKGGGMINLSRGEQRVFDYMTEFGKITSLEAFVDLGETRLSGRIFDLKKKGVNISTRYVYVKNRYGESRRVKEYTIG